MQPDMAGDGYYRLDTKHFNSRCAGSAIPGKRMVSCRASLRSARPTIYIADGRLSVRYQALEPGSTVGCIPCTTNDNRYGQNYGCQWKDRLGRDAFGV